MGQELTMCILMVSRAFNVENSKPCPLKNTAVYVNHDVRLSNDNVPCEDEREDLPGDEVSECPGSFLKKIYLYNF